MQLKNELKDYEQIIKDETEKCRVTTFSTPDGRGTYKYVILPFESRLTPRYQNAVVEGMTIMLEEELRMANVILLAEAKAFLLSEIAAKNGLDAVLIRKRDYRLPDQVVIEQVKAYKDRGSMNFMYCVGLDRGDKPLLIDDIISSAGTAISIIDTVKRCGFDIVGVGTVYERGDGIKRLYKNTNYLAKGLARLELKNNRPVISSFYRP